MPTKATITSTAILRRASELISAEVDSEALMESNPINYCGRDRFEHLSYSVYMGKLPSVKATAVLRERSFNNAIRTGPSENPPAPAFRVRTRRYPPGLLIAEPF